MQLVQGETVSAKLCCPGGIAVSAVIAPWCFIATAVADTAYKLNNTSIAGTVYFDRD